MGQIGEKEKYSNSAIEDKLVEILRKYYINEIDQLLPNSTFTIDVSKEELTDIFVDYGDEFEKLIRNAITTIIKEKLGVKAIKYYNNLKINLISDQLLDIEQLTSEHLNSIVYIKAQCIDIQLPQAYISEATYLCKVCGEETKLPMKPSSFLYKYIKCHNEECDGEKMFLDMSASKQGRVQKITLQDIRIENPRYLKAELVDNLVEKINLGDKLKISGLYIAPRVNDESNRGDLVLEIISFQPLEEEKDIELSQERIKFYEDFTLNDIEKYKTQLIDSYAPHIFKRDLEKWAIMLNLVSAPDMLPPYRSTSTLLLIGDTGTGKSELLKFGLKVVKKSAYADGTAMTGKGLKYTLDTVGGQRILRAGILIENNFGHVYLDELDKAKSEDRQELNQPIEQGIATYHKAGFHQSRECKVSIIAASNPHNLKWDENLPIMENIKPLEDTTVNRFDIIIRVKNVKSEELDRLKAKHMMEIIRGKKTEMSNDELAGILSYCKKLNPELTEEAERLAEDFFVKIRNANYSDNSLVLGERQLLGIIRLSKCWAKLLFKKQVTKEIIKETIKFYFDCLETFGLKILEGQHQIPLQTRDMNVSQAFENIINNIKNAQGMFTEADLLALMVEDPHWTSLSSARIYWELVKKQRLVYEPKAGKFKLV